MSGISVISNFDANGTFPIDSRLVATNSAMRDTMPYIYEGLKVYVIEDKKTYTWNGTEWKSETNGIYGGSGSLVGNTVVNIGQVGPSVGSQSNYFIFLSPRTAEKSVFFQNNFVRIGVGLTQSDFTRKLYLQESPSSILEKSGMGFNSSEVYFSVDSKKVMGLTNSGIMIYNYVGSLTYSATIRTSPSVSGSWTFSLPNISGTFAMIGDIVTNNSNLQTVTTTGNTTSNNIVLSVTTNPLTTSTSSDSGIDIRSSTGSYFGGTFRNTTNGDIIHLQQPSALKNFSTGVAISLTSSNGGIRFINSIRSLLIVGPTLSSNQTIYFPTRSGTVSVSTSPPPYLGTVFLSTGGWRKSYTPSVTTTILSYSASNPMTSTGDAVYNGATGGYVQLTANPANLATASNIFYIQLPTPVGRTSSIINFIWYNWLAVAPSGFDNIPIYMTGSSGYTISNGQAYWDYQIGLTGGFTNSWYGGKAGSLISDGTKWIKWIYDYTRLTESTNRIIVDSQGYKGIGKVGALGSGVSTIGKRSGKWYWETKLNLENGFTERSKVGILAKNSSDVITNELGFENLSIALIGGTMSVGKFKIIGPTPDDILSTTLNVLSVNPGIPINPGEVIGHSLDLDSATRTYTVYRNGTSDPSNVYFSINLTPTPISTIWYPAVCSDGTTNSVDINFGQFGFSYSPPAGFNRGIFFKGWNDSNITSTTQSIGW